MSQNRNLWAERAEEERLRIRNDWMRPAPARGLDAAQGVILGVAIATIFWIVLGIVLWRMG